MEAGVYKYVKNTQKNEFAVSIEMLSFEGFRLARNSISVSGFKVSEALYGQTEAHDDSIEAARSTRGNVVTY